MIKNAVMTKLKVQCGLERCDRKLNDKFEVIFGLVVMIEDDLMT
jgi:hypothetical protein